ncbi:unnamed protein product [marine sediment metagenome]|uniref:Guanylate cyclase domain-containing protein n=1 Tax=marine sediment metagenome TaxID=412755 RepID=X1LL81_9ZZZZ
MFGKKEVFEWLSHRAGVKRLDKMPLIDVTKALELNKPSRSFIDSFGKHDIWGFAGFIDLVDFSKQVMGLPNKAMSDYLAPFLKGLVDLVNSHYGLVDKTIGDEVMFILPDMEEDGGVPAVLEMGQLLGGIYDLQKQLGEKYSFRIGLAYGGLYIDQVCGVGYSEWTTVGEVVNLAKRLHILKELKDLGGVKGAFGVLCHEQYAMEYFESILSIIAGVASRMTHKILKDPVTNLKGVSAARCALLVPKSED